MADDHHAISPGHIVACAGRFWQDGEPVLLHGLNTSGVGQLIDMTDEDYAQIQAWHMNVVRLRVGWKFFEPNPPTPDGSGGWIHDYRTALVPELRQQIAFARAHGIAVLIENRCFCGEGWPLWVSEAAYNSHQIDYDLTDQTQRLDFLANYWSDDLLKQFTNLVSWVHDEDGLLGYGPLNEPSTGSLPPTHATTQLTLDWQLELAQATRAIDPNRIIFFTTRGSSAVGTATADLTPFAALGNVAFDVHDFFGGRWGSGSNLSGDPNNESYGETSQSMYAFTLSLDAPVYLGTTADQMRFVQSYLDAVIPLGIPLFIGEFTGNTEGHPRDPNLLSLHGTMAFAFNRLGVAWTALSYDGFHSVFDPQGNPMAWAAVLCIAAAYPESGSDCPIP